MRKTKIGMMAGLLMLGTVCASMTVCAGETEADTANYLDMKAVGYSVKNPDSWEGLKGQIMIQPLSAGALSDDPEVYMSMLIYMPEEGKESSQDMMALAGTITSPGIIFTIKGDKDRIPDVMEELGIPTPEDADKIRDDLTKIGEADGYQFYALYTITDEYAASLNEEEREEYNSLPELVTEELEQSVFYAPVDPLLGLVGQKISFTSEDLDGNPLTSKDLFAENEITMVNCWGIWCHNCVDEMEELAAIHTRLQEKGCGVVGLEWEQDPSEEVYQEARDLLAEKGTNYPSALMPEGIEIMDCISGFPTTFFVDREGTILADPIVGARVDEYEPALEALLENGSASETETEKETASDASYKVYVKDEEGNPLEEIAVQFCDDTSCRFGETDEDGCAEFEITQGNVYEVHILEAPDEYAFDEEEVFTTDTSASEMTIELKKAE